MDYFDDADKRRHLKVISTELNAAKRFFATTEVIPDDQTMFVGWGNVETMRIYAALRLAWLSKVPDNILARLLLVAHHCSFVEPSALMFNWDTVANGTAK